MQVAEQDSLPRIWESHREPVRRLLIGLARDFDLADDLLQETYLRAQAGMAEYRRENPRGWLSAIARNAYLAHARRRRMQAEIPLGPDERTTDDPAVCPHRRLDLLAARQAMADLPPPLRTALIMKHYGGFTYQEIGAQMHCPIGTAKWRVSEAIARLRTALEIRERFEMACTDPMSDSILDYLYGIVPPDEGTRLRSHLRQCDRCREQVEELRKIISALEALAGDHRMMHLVELGRGGAPITYATWTFLNDGESAMTTVGFGAEKDYALTHLLQDGDEMSFEKRQSPECDHRFAYTANLPRPISPGHRVNLLCVFRPNEKRWARREDDGTFRFWWGQAPGEHETAYVQVIRLPDSAQCVSVEPQPNEMNSNGVTTLIWRCVLPPMHQFECIVHYRL